MDTGWPTGWPTHLQVAFYLFFVSLTKIHLTWSRRCSGYFPTPHRVWDTKPSAFEIWFPQKNECGLVLFSLWQEEMQDLVLFISGTLDFCFCLGLPPSAPGPLHWSREFHPPSKTSHTAFDWWWNLFSLLLCVRTCLFFSPPG